MENFRYSSKKLNKNERKISEQIFSQQRLELLSQQKLDDQKLNPRRYNVQTNIYDDVIAVAENAKQLIRDL